MASVGPQRHGKGLIFVPTNRHTHTYIYTGCNRRKGPDFGRVFLMLNYNPKHLYPKLNGYGDNGHRNVWASGVSTYCTPSVTSYLSIAHARPRHGNAASLR